MPARISSRRGRVAVGPPGGPTIKISAGFKITVTDLEPYDLVLDVSWDESRGRHTLRRLTIEAQPEGDYVGCPGSASSHCRRPSPTHLKPRVSRPAGNRSSAITPTATRWLSTPSSTCCHTHSGVSGRPPRLRSHVGCLRRPVQSMSHEPDKPACCPKPSSESRPAGLASWSGGVGRLDERTDSRLKRDVEVGRARRPHLYRFETVGERSSRSGIHDRRVADSPVPRG